jgi:hypothetical protein
MQSSLLSGQLLPPSFRTKLERLRQMSSWNTLAGESEKSKRHGSFPKSSATGSASGLDA